MLKFRQIPVGILQVNCYVLWQEDRKDALIIDPGDESDKIIEAVETLSLAPRGILLTHTHVDHIRAVSDVSARFGIPVWCHALDRDQYASPDNALLPWIPAAQDLPEITDPAPALPGVDCRILHTPGHTPGGVCYYFPEDRLLFSGDTLFKGTYGRTDFLGGSQEALFRSIRESLFTLPADTSVRPGHSAATTIAAEIAAQGATVGLH